MKGYATRLALTKRYKTDAEKAYRGFSCDVTTAMHVGSIKQ